MWEGWGQYWGDSISQSPERVLPTPGWPQMTSYTALEYTHTTLKGEVCLAPGVPNDDSQAGAVARGHDL